jgi:AAA+ ATPase superfamily predicted ATPase
MEQPIFLGRKKELKQINRLMQRKRNIIIWGAKGEGKTTIIQKVLTNRKGTSIPYASDSHTLKTAMGDLLQRDVQLYNMLTLRKEFYKFLQGNYPYIVFDHIVSVGPRYFSFFEYLLTQDVPFIVLSRGTTRKDLHPLGFLTLYADLVEVTNFPKCDADSFVFYYVRTLNLAVQDKQEFADEVFRLSSGNPAIIQQLCFLSKDVKYFQGGSLNLGLVDLDRRIEEIITK